MIARRGVAAQSIRGRYEGARANAYLNGSLEEENLWPLREDQT